MFNPLNMNFPTKQKYSNNFWTLWNWKIAPTEHIYKTVIDQFNNYVISILERLLEADCVCTPSKQTKSFPTAKQLEKIKPISIDH